MCVGYAGNAGNQYWIVKEDPKSRMQAWEARSLEVSSCCRANVQVSEEFRVLYKYSGVKQYLAKEK